MADNNQHAQDTNWLDSCSFEQVVEQHDLLHHQYPTRLTQWRVKGVPTKAGIFGGGDGGGGSLMASVLMRLGLRLGSLMSGILLNPHLNYLVTVRE